MTPDETDLERAWRNLPKRAIAKRGPLVSVTEEMLRECDDMRRTRSELARRSGLTHEHRPRT